jgi:hypothetical protein
MPRIFKSSVHLPFIVIFLTRFRTTVTNAAVMRQQGRNNKFIAQWFFMSLCSKSPYLSFSSPGIYSEEFYFPIYFKIN